MTQPRTDTIEILLVDDEPDYAETMAFWLKAKGYRVTTAGSGEEGLARLAERVPALVFLDVIMPGMDGIETLRRIRAGYGALPVIMVTAHASDERIQAASRLGVIGFFPKAADFSEAARLIDRALKDFPSRRAA